MFLATADCSEVKGWVVPRSSDTVVPTAAAADSSTGEGVAALAAGAGAGTLAGAVGGARGPVPFMALPPFLKASMSEAVIRPAGPVPAHEASQILCAWQSGYGPVHCWHPGH